MEDKQTILKLYEMCVDDIYKMTSVDLELSKKINEKEDLLNLTKEQKNILEEINNYRNERTVELTKNTFIYAFSLANKLIIESLKNSK